MRSFIMMSFIATLATALSAAQLDVGEGKAFARIEEALAKAAPGDTIIVHALPGGRAYEKPALLVRKARISLVAAPAADGKRVALSGAGFEYSGAGSVPRAIVQFDRGADRCILDGFELRDAHNESFNGAGVRINQANDIVVRNCEIRDNDMGIMSNGDGTQATAVNQLIEGCHIHSNGNAKHPGYNHNLYLGGTSVTLSGCEVHSSLTGHNVKSRAHHTRIECCYIHDSANRECDLVDAKGDTTSPESHAVVIGSIIVKDPRCEGNRAVIHFGQDGGNEHDGTIFVVNTTIMTPFIAPVVDLSAPKAKLFMANTIVATGESPRSGQTLVAARAGESKGRVAGTSNWFANGFGGQDLPDVFKASVARERGATPPFADPGKGDYRLARTAAGITDAGTPLAQIKLPAVPGAPSNTSHELREYAHPLKTAPRTTTGKPDMGAFEFVR